MDHNKTKITNRLHLFLSIQIILLILFFSCQTTQSTLDSSFTNTTEKQEICPGIVYTRFENASFPLIYHLVEIDLSNECISLTASPTTAEAPAYIENDDKISVIKGETTRTFAKRTGCVVAINGSPFNYTDKKGKVNKFATKSGGLLFDSGYRLLSGIQINRDGTEFGYIAKRYSAVMFSEAQGGRIFVSQKEIPFIVSQEETRSAQKNNSNNPLVVGGFFTILKDNQMYGDYASIQDSRTAIGFSADGLTMFILSVEGEIKFQSRGLDYKGCAEILKEAGATDAIEMDGGGSTSLIINGKNMLSYTTHRKVANNIGVFNIEK